jgi:membrane-bound lytic murein transglycosylase B
MLKVFSVRAVYLLVMASLVISARAEPAEPAEPDFTGFDEWLVKTALEAQKRGISKQTVDLAFAGLEPDPRVIGFDRKQPEFVQTFEEYLEARVTEFRINRARQYFQEEEKLLLEIAGKYDVDPQYLVAFWGLESSFGRYQGKYSIVRSLATLGFDPRRSKFFTEELFKALQILEEGHVSPEEFVGGWAGAMGQNQFMPSSFLNYAADFDGDGKKNIWSSRPDVWASIANYLHKNGWKKGAGWGSRVDLPGDLDLETLRPEKVSSRCRALRHHTRKLSLQDWAALGVKPANPLKDSQVYALVIPDDAVEVSYMVGGNFRTILSYNCANKYAVSVGLLADMTKSAL